MPTLQLTSKEHDVIFTVLTTVDEKLSEKGLEGGVVAELIGNVLSRMTAPNKEDTKTVTVLKRAFGSAMPKREEQQVGIPLMAKMYEQGASSIELYKKDGTWTLRGITDGRAKVSNLGLDALWKRGADKEGVVFTTGDDDVAVGIAEKLGLVKCGSKVVGAEDYYC